jgi:hypothetical protein
MHEALRAVPQRLRDRPSRWTLRALPVAHCGWSSPALKTVEVL